MNSQEELLSYTHNLYTTERIYEDEPIRISAEKQKELIPKEYRQMRKLDFESPFSKRNDAKIFYLQAKFMENFEDDFAYDKPFFHYFPTYRSMTIPELRGYYTWRTKLRHGDLQKTSISYAYVYLYELLHGIGSSNTQEGFDKLVSFYESYRQLDSSIDTYARQWIIDYGIYYHVEPDRLLPHLDLSFDHALIALLHSQDLPDAQLIQAIIELSSYNLPKSRCYKKYPEEMTSILCRTYRAMDQAYRDARHVPYTQKLFGKPASVRYVPFLSAVFYPHEKSSSAEYRISEVQSYNIQNGVWYQNRSYQTEQKSRELGDLVRCCDRILREHYHLTPGLKYGDETDEMIAAVQHAVEDQKKASAPKITFDLSLLDQIRVSSDQIGEKLLTEEERMSESLPIINTVPAPAAEDATTAENTPAAASPCPLSGDELDFMRILLYGGDLSAFLMRTHRMSSLLAESVNECLYDEFMDTVIEFDGDTPIIVEDYLQDLKGMIPE